MLREFDCTYVESGGTERKVRLLAESREEAIKRLKEQNLLVTEVKERDRERSFSFRRKRLSLSDMYNVANQLSILLRSGMKIDSAIGLIASSSTNEFLRERLELANSDIKEGHPVSAALESRGLFPQTYISMIHVGESAGDLKTAFENVAEYLRFQMELRREIVNSLTYPAFLILASIATLIFMFNFVIPKFFAIFSAGSELPLPARFLLRLGSVLNLRIFSAISGILVLMGFLLKAGKLKQRTSWTKNVLFRIPLLRTMLLYLQLSRFFYCMHSMLRSGVDLLKALRLSAEILQDGSLQRSVLGSINDIKRGSKIAEVFQRIPAFPDVIPNLVRVGEESGDLQGIFLELHLLFSERFKTMVRRFLTLLEPSVIMLMGLIVGFIVISLILTVMNIGAIRL
ncbi:MAG: type II secretion system F family protein [Candidatus Bathyarchaeia archaeon]